MDLFGNIDEQRLVHVNIYADESTKHCPYSDNIWHYIGIIVEDLEFPLLDDIICQRYRGNFDEESVCYEKNNKIVHWNNIRTADTKNICKRWFQYILNFDKSRKTFYSYILGLNNSYLNKEEFDTTDHYNSVYNRFFRTVIQYVLKSFFGGKVVVENIFHEEGQQFNNEYFPWYTIYKLERGKNNISFNCSEIIQLPKDHKKDKRSNLIQLCDAILGVSTSIIHGINESSRSNYREELADLYIELFKRIITKPRNINSSYNYYNRVGIGFFPKEKTKLGDIERMKNQFYTNRPLKYIEQKSKQIYLIF